MKYVWLLWYKMERGSVDWRKQDQQVAVTLGALLIEAKGVFDAVSRSESAHVSKGDKQSVVEASSLRESLTSSRTRPRWFHSIVKVSDGLLKFDHRAVNLIRRFSQRLVWEIACDPTVTSADKLRAHARTKKQQSRKAPPVLTPGALGLC